MTLGYTEMYQSIDTTIMGKKTYDYVINTQKHFRILKKNATSLPLLKMVQMNMWIL